MRVIRLIVVLGAALAPVLGCEDEPVLPDLRQTGTSPPAQAEAEMQEPPAPTTQELMAAPRSRVPLEVIPLSVQAPPGWRVETLGEGIVLLTGPTPSGEAQVQLARRPVMTPEQLESVISLTQRDLEQNPGRFTRVDVRPFAEQGRILEKQSVGPSIPAELDEQGNVVLPAATAYNWTITVFQPTGEGFEPYELNFIALTREQIVRDEPLLRQIIDSLALDGTAAAP